MNQRSYLWLCIFGLLFVIGCGKSIDPQNDAEKTAAVDLKLFGGGYEVFLNNESVPPQKLDDLKTTISSDRPIDFDHYKIIWGVDLKAIKEDRAVLAYEITVPEKGGMVLFHNGKVERVTAEEFQQLPKATIPKPIIERAADVTFTPTEYFAEFNKIHEEMAQKYQGKVVELKGIAKGFGRLSGNIELLVISPSKEHDYVRCFLNDGEPWTKVSKGQQVTVKGFVRSPQGYPMLVGCDFITTSPNTTVTITAEELAKEIAADPLKASEKYKGKSLILTGEVTSTSDLTTFRFVKLKGTTDHPIECVFHIGSSTKERDKKLVPGAKLKVYGEYDGSGYKCFECELISE